MVWNIIKKDWKLMGRYALGVIALQLLFMLFHQQQGGFRPHGPSVVPFLLMHPPLLADVVLWPLAAIVWVIVLLHQDPLPGTRQDWLIRPIPRMKMLLAKLLLATMVLQGSTLLSDLIQGLAGGFPLGQVLRAALVRAAIGFVLLTLPALLLGALTQSLTESIVLSAALGVSFFLLTLFGAALAGPGNLFDPTAGTAIHWIPNLLRLALVLSVGAALLWMQYRTRATLRGRILLGALLVLLVITQAIPWKTVFAVQSRLSPQPGAASGIDLSWHPIPSPQEGGNGWSTQNQGLSMGRPVIRPWARLTLPVNVTGLSQDTLLLGDSLHVRLFDAGGNALHESTANGMSLIRTGPQGGPAPFKQLILLPLELYDQDPTRLVRVEANYSLTLLRLAATSTMPAIGGDALVPNLGRCVSHVDPENTNVQVQCTQMGRAFLCASASMQDPDDGAITRTSTNCSPDYAPYQQRPIPDTLSDISFLFQFRDRRDKAHFPIDASRVPHAQVVFRVYDIADHFTRTVNSPLLPMKDIAEK